MVSPLFPPVPNRNGGKPPDGPRGMAAPCTHPVGNRSHRVCGPAVPSHTHGGVCLSAQALLVWDEKTQERMSTHPNWVTHVPGESRWLELRDCCVLPQSHQVFLVALAPLLGLYDKVSVTRGQICPFGWGRLPRGQTGCLNTAPLLPHAFLLYMLVTNLHL